MVFQNVQILKRDILPMIFISEPTPYQENEPQTLMFPFPCFIDCTLGIYDDEHLLSGPILYIFVSSPHNAKSITLLAILY